MNVHNNNNNNDNDNDNDNGNNNNNRPLLSTSVWARLGVPIER